MLDLVERPRDAKVIGSRWVYALKKDENGIVERYKARLVAQGCKQNKGIDYKETYTPIIDVTLVRSLMSTLR